MNNKLNIISNISTIINIILLISLISIYIIADHNHILFISLLFALIGSLTNSLAIYMLFEKIPFIYGSGIIELNFYKFKSSIKDLIMNQFFSKDQIEKFLSKSQNNIKDKIDFNKIFKELCQDIMDSSIGPMINMVGGMKILEPLKEPLQKKLTDISSKIIDNDNMSDNIEHIIDDKLNLLTPKMIKNMIKKIIREHLSWLVIWGAIMGFICGFTSQIIISLLKY